MNPITLRDALLGGPGLDGYAYNADVYCVDCGADLTRLAFKDDKAELPAPIFFGESDTPQHCAKCGEFLYGREFDRS